MERTSNILINCDMGESYGAWTKGNDKQIMPYIDLANIACGFHASDPLNMEKTVLLAKKAKVKIGAHPSYPDLVGFGRRNMSVSSDELRAIVAYQIGALQGICTMHQAQVEYVKPHGALYNTMMKDFTVLKAIMLAVKETLADCPLMVMATPQYEAVERLAQEIGIPLLFEAFSDRAYTDDGYLVDRTQPGAVHNSVNKIVSQVKEILQTGNVTSINGNSIALKVDTICIHGDGEHATAIARAVSNNNGV